MIGSIFVKECKMWLKSIIFYAYFIILLIFYFMQMQDVNALEKPEPGEENYGTIISDDKNDIMNTALGNLMEDYYLDDFCTYPLGFYKQIVLSSEEKEKIASYIDSLTGLSTNEWKQIIDNYFDEIQSNNDNIVYHIEANVSNYI